MDVRRTFSALVANLRQGGYAQGGSTLTQQLARAIFLSPRKTLSRKVNEALVSFEIERRYSKDQILTMYANEIYLGHGNYGIEAASRYYFGKSVKDITLAEAALLAGIVQRPEDQSPFRNPALATQRRSTALRRMRAEGYITEAERKAAEDEPLALLAVASGVDRRARTSARTSASTSRRRTARRTSTGVACASSRPSTPRCRRGRKNRSAGACARSRATTVFTGRAICSRRAIGRSRATSIRPGRTRRSRRARRSAASS